MSEFFTKKLGFMTKIHYILFWNNLCNIFGTMVNLLSSLAWPDFLGGVGNVLLKSYYDDDEVMNIQLALPGLSKDDVDVSVDGEDVVVIKTPDSKFVFGLEDSADPEAVSAKIENGVLTLKFPERENYSKEVKVE